MGDNQYSFSLITFSPSGKLVQIEHALTVVGSGQTSLGIKAANGVVIATEKKLPSILVDETAVKLQIQFNLLKIHVHRRNQAVFAMTVHAFHVIAREKRIHKQSEGLFWYHVQQQ